jgi:hypothetical protein
MPEQQAGDPNLVEKLEAKVNDIDDLIIRSYEAYMAVDQELQRVILKYSKKMEAADILEKARAELREKERQMRHYQLLRRQQLRREHELRTGSENTSGHAGVDSSTDDVTRRAIDRSLQYASGQTVSEVKSAKSGVKVVDINARGRASTVTSYEPPPSRPEDTNTRLYAEHAQERLRTESEATRQPRPIKNTTARKPTFTALPPPALSPPPRPRSSSDDGGEYGRTRTHVSTSHVRSNSYDDMVNQRQNQILAEALRKPESGERPVAGSNYYEAMLSHQRSQPPAESVRTPETKQKSVTKTKDKTPYVPRVTAESEAVLEAERREFRNKLKAKFFGGSSKGG